MQTKNKKAKRTVSILAVLGVTGVICGILADSTTFFSWLGKNDNDSGSRAIEVNHGIEYQPVDYNSPPEYDLPPMVNPVDISGKSIPQDSTFFNGSYYYIFDMGVSTYEKAEKYCESLGGHLAVINDTQENDFLYDYVFENSCYDVAYIGYSDSEKEGEWKWVAGESYFENWESDGINTDEDDYAMLDIDCYYSKRWNTGSFDDFDQKTFICEWDNLNESQDNSDTNQVNIDVNQGDANAYQDTSQVNIDTSANQVNIYANQSDIDTNIYQGEQGLNQDTAE